MWQSTCGQRGTSINKFSIDLMECDWFRQDSILDTDPPIAQRWANGFSLLYSCITWALCLWGETQELSLQSCKPELLLMVKGIEDLWKFKEAVVMYLRGQAAPYQELLLQCILWSSDLSLISHCMLSSRFRCLKAKLFGGIFCGIRRPEILGYFCWEVAGHATSWFSWTHICRMLTPGILLVKESASLGTNGALLFSSCFLTTQGAKAALVGDGWLLSCVPLTRASMACHSITGKCWQGCYAL